MAEDKENARPTTTAPSLLGASAAARGEAESSRILAALEGREPDAEVKHLAARRDSRAGRWIAPVLLLALLAGGITWIMLENGSAPLIAQAPDPAIAPAATPPGSLPQASLPSALAPTASAASQSAAPPAVASIVDEAPRARDAGQGRGESEPEGVPANPLSILAMAAPASPAAPAPGPTRQAAEQGKQQDGAARAARPAKAPPRKAKAADTDAALLSALMDYGLPPASPPGTRVYKSEGVFMRVMPGSPLAERLKECEKLSFIEGQQCRLRVCAGQWGTAAECPTPQAHVEP